MVRGRPSAHRGRSVPGLIVYDGDSHTATNVYPPLCTARLPGTWLTFNVGIGSQRITQILVTAPTNVDARYRSVRPHNICVVFCGTNDIANDSESAETVQGRLQTYCAARKAAGFQVVVTTLFPRGAAGVTSYETRRLAVNDWLRAHYGEFSDALADVQTDARLGAQDAQLNTPYYQADTIHLTALGSEILAGTVARAVATLL